MTREELNANAPGWYIMKFKFQGLVCQEPALLNENHEVTVAGTSQVVDVRDIERVLWKIETTEPRKPADPSQPGIYRVRFGDQWKVGEYFEVTKLWAIAGLADWVTTNQIEEIGDCLGRPSWKRLASS